MLVVDNIGTYRDLSRQLGLTQIRTGVSVTYVALIFGGSDVRRVRLPGSEKYYHFFRSHYLGLFKSQPLLPLSAALFSALRLNALFRHKVSYDYVLVLTCVPSPSPVAFPPSYSSSFLNLSPDISRGVGLKRKREKEK